MVLSLLTPHIKYYTSANLGQLAALLQLRRPLLQVDGGVGEVVVEARLLQAVVGERLRDP